MGKYAKNRILLRAYALPACAMSPAQMTRSPGFRGTISLWMWCVVGPPPAAFLSCTLFQAKSVLHRHVISALTWWCCCYCALSLRLAAHQLLEMFGAKRALLVNHRERAFFSTRLFIVMLLIISHIRARRHILAIVELLWRE